MVKLKTKPANMLTQVYTLFFIMLVFLHISCGCGERPEDEATKVAENEFLDQHQDISPQLQFEKVLQALSDPKGTAERREAHTDIAIKIIENHLADLDKSIDSAKNPLYLILSAIGELSGSEVLLVRKHTRIEKYLQIFEKLREKVSLSDKLLSEFHDRARINGIESLYYPLVVLGEMKADTDVAYKDHNLDKDISILWWALVKGGLNRKLQKEMVLALANSPKNTSKINEFFEVSYIGSNITPAMYIAFQAHMAINEAEANDIAEMFKSCLSNENIKLFQEASPSQKVVLSGTAFEKLEKQPLLSFIIFNAISKKVKLNEKWLSMLDDALQAGDLKNKISGNKKKIKDYVIKYIDAKEVDKYENAKKQNFDIEEMYDQKLKGAVREKLEKYVYPDGKKIPVGGKNKPKQGGKGDKL